MINSVWFKTIAILWIDMEAMEDMEDMEDMEAMEATESVLTVREMKKENGKQLKWIVIWIN